jgi:hypothetical protein
VQGGDEADPLEQPGPDHLQGAAGGELLGRLEDQPYGAAQVQTGLGEGEAGAGEHGGVHVVTAGVADPSHPGPVGDVLDVGDGQGVDVGAQGHDRAAGADVTDQPGAGVQDARGQAGGGQLAGDPLGGGPLLPAEFGVGVQVPAQRDQVGLVAVEPGVKPGVGVRHLAADVTGRATGECAGAG